MQLKVNKCDGSMEIYLHTKVMGAIAAALCECGILQAGLAEQLAEAVTTYLRRRHNAWEVSSDDIHAMAQAALCDTGYPDAALALHDHRLNRHIKRGRIEVVRVNKQVGMGAEEGIWAMQWHPENRQPWNKSIIVQDLQEKLGMPTNLARAIAGMVEEKVLRLECRLLTSSLVRELVFNELASIRQAEESPAHEAEMETEKREAVLV